MINSNVSFDVNPTSRNLLEELAETGYLNDLIHAGGRIHQAGCNGCIGMGQAPATGRNSLRTVPRNFPGRSGNDEDSVFLCSTETAVASALQGVITDPRELGETYPKKIKYAKKTMVNKAMMEPPLEPSAAQQVKLVKGPNIATLPEISPLPQNLNLTVILKVGDNISTDDIMPAGARVLPFRSNIPKISEFVFERIDNTYPARAAEFNANNIQHVIVGGENYGQGSSREHAALAPRYLGLQLVIAKSFARIHWQNLINFGVLPLTFKNPKDYAALELNAIVSITAVFDALKNGTEILAQVKGNISKEIILVHKLSVRQIEILAAGGLINWVKNNNNR